MKFFSADSKLFRFLSRLWDVITLNFFWFILAGLPAVGGLFAGQLTHIKWFYLLGLISVVTFGPATVSAYAILLRMVDDTEGYIVRPFFRGFRDNLKQGIPLGAFSILVVAAAYTELYVLSAQMGYIAFFILGIFTTAIAVALLPFAFPLTARYENKLLNHMRNAFQISMRFFGRSLLMWVILALELVVFLWNNYTQIVGLILGPMVMMLTISGFAMKVFREIEKDGGVMIRKTEEDLYNEEIEREVEAALKKEKMK